MSRIQIAIVLCMGVFAYQAVFAQQPLGGRRQPQQTRLQQKSPEARPFSGKCDEKNGRYAAEGQCDAYIECVDGVPEEKLCADGLLFNDKVGLFTFPCQYPIDVDCSTRARLQPAQSTDECPHQFGYFRLGDSANCGKFMNCADGRGYTFDCPEGLAFNKDTYRCDWADQVADCDAEAFLGFTCPPELKLNGVTQENQFYRSPVDCQRYYVCLEGKPRLYSCGEGYAFNDLINACDAAENVTSCASNDQYKARPIQLTRLEPTRAPQAKYVSRGGPSPSRLFGDNGYRG